MNPVMILKIVKTTITVISATCEIIQIIKKIK